MTPLEKLKEQIRTYQKDNPQSADVCDDIVDFINSTSLPAEREAIVNALKAGLRTPFPSDDPERHSELAQQYFNETFKK